ncbi:hypothetical protein FB567DRAFT_248471 [Paraphoma chrysanthemicola]|uniref:Uncharacterized protein n=1 Tax=Paraphoma chrysanthemicola TaxID=798071 RepID=A0A8K0VRT4_9PLEO|nr:hypothetical protein FB567DRAFT_248471 [Paraphoma chrysanthemicola]
MTETIEHFLKGLYRFPTNQAVEKEEVEQYLRPWGFTTYRTSYGPGSDEQWQKLLQKATASAKDRLKKQEGVKENPDATAKVLEQFSLDARSDPDTLEGLTLEDVRQLYLDGSGGQPLHVDSSGKRLFLLADDQVLQDPDLARLKVVAADYDSVAAVPKNSRVGPQRYFGWMTMPTTAIYHLWDALELFDFEQIINRTSPGGPGVYWDPDFD